MLRCSGDLRVSISFAHKLNAALDAELARRRQWQAEERAIAEQSRYGWYDERGVRQGGLIAFVRYFWSVLEPATSFVDGWPLHAIAEHLEAVSKGDITRLLINVAPGFSKSLMTNVFFPAWEWGPMGRPGERYLSFSYSSILTERDNRRFRDLITSEPYQRLYGDVFSLRNDAIGLVLNTATGWKQASSCGGTATGQRGSRVLLDDPNSVSEAESEAIRTATNTWFRESMSNRVQDADRDVIVCIQQRTHSEDVSGLILNEGLPYVHLCIPYHFDSKRQLDANYEPYKTSIGWSDPRWLPVEQTGSVDASIAASDGTPAWSERFSPAAIERMRLELGRVAWAGQYEQIPMPRGGSIFRREDFRLWDPVEFGMKPNVFPPLDYIVASLDSAFTAKEENDPSALTVWGVFDLPDMPGEDRRGGSFDERTGQVWSTSGRRRIILLHAWRKHLQFSGPRIERNADEVILPGMDIDLVKHRNRRYRARTMEHWGLIEWVRDTCRRFKVHKLLIEAKASGISASQELRHRFGDEGFSIELVQVKGDKLARAYAAQPTFSQGLVFAPEREWSEFLIDEMTQFPRSKWKDLTDSATQAIAHLRARGLASTDEEAAADEIAALAQRGRERRLNYF